MRISDWSSDVCSSDLWRRRRRRDTNARGAAGQFGHDDLGVDAIGEHMAVVAIARDDAVLVAVERRLEPDRHRFLADIQVAKAADQAEPVKLPRLRSEEHTSELQSLMRISYAVFCLKKKNTIKPSTTTIKHKK